jgi:uncharacterized protein YbcC (UPF0753/DUF2309 family)
MSAVFEQRASWLESVIASACARVAPAWPLDRLIATNPLWSHIDAPLPDVAARLHALWGSTLLMPRAWYRERYREGLLRDEHLLAALAEHGPGLSLEALRGLLEQDEPAPAVRARVVDVVDAGRDLARELSWRSTVSHLVSQCCAAYFDDGQAQAVPDRDGGLLSTWRRLASRDRTPALLMDFAHCAAMVESLPTTAEALIGEGLAALSIAPADAVDYLYGLLLDQHGWASVCAYRRFTARLAGGDDDSIVDLLAIRVAWEWLLLRHGGEALARRWQLAMSHWPAIDARARSARGADWVLQRAVEWAWQAPVVAALPAGLATPRPEAPALQAVFCIDVRSEIFRRALEATSPAIQTLGFAGFFGLPVTFRPLGADSARPHLPGPLAPRFHATDVGVDDEDAHGRRRRLQDAQRWQGFRSDALSAFSFVDALGLTYAKHLIADAFGLSSPSLPDEAGLADEVAGRRRPRLVAGADGRALSLDERVGLARTMLRAMSLRHGFARIVLLVGHGSSTRNNAHAAGLDCGACGGQTGEVSARIAAALLNDPAVRAGLVSHGITIPAETMFIASLHDTTTDDVHLFELEDLPTSHGNEIATVQAWLRAAGERARAERAPLLGVAPPTSSPSSRSGAAGWLRRVVRSRSRDWAEQRPEWGLVDNAALIVAPREHCRHLDLGGRVFLHEYRYAEDDDGSVLELIMTAPMVVTHWINFQYYASTVDNLRFGSGNKVLHDVGGGHLGVFEGNGGDLRIGLPMQSLHDGERFVHTPRRLSVFIEAPRDAIDAVLARHAHIRSLVENGWLFLFQFGADSAGVCARRAGRWLPLSLPEVS